MNCLLGIPRELKDIIVKMLSKTLNTAPEVIHRAALSEGSLKEPLEPADDPGAELKKEMSKKFKQRVNDVKKKLRKAKVITWKKGDELCSAVRGYR